MKDYKRIRLVSYRSFIYDHFIYLGSALYEFLMYFSVSLVELRIVCLSSFTTFIKTI